MPFGMSVARAAAATTVRRLDVSLDTLVAPDARLETLFQGDSIFDGPVWVRNHGPGYLIFSDVPGNAINRLKSDGSVSVLLSGIFTGKDPSEAYQSSGSDGRKKQWMLGANGITFDRQGRLVYCAYSNGEIVRLEGDGRRTVLARKFEANRLNAPNDLVFKSDGSLYFTDSRAGSKRTDGEGVPYEGLYVLRAGKVQLLNRDIDHPNGVAFSPDEKFLYVTNTRRKNILRFDVTGAGVENEQLFVDMKGDGATGAPDGIKVDRNGNVYSTGPGGVWIISAEGKHLGTIQTPKPITNLAFGDRNAKTLYMTAFGAVYRIRLKVSGR
jgi:gluconolactonase